MTVTRLQIADLVEDAFGPDGADTAALLDTARDQGGSPEVLACLERLPRRHFRRMQDLWAHLEGLPVD